MATSLQAERLLKQIDMICADLSALKQQILPLTAQTSETVSIDDVAEMFGVSVVTIRRKVKDPGFPQPFAKHPMRWRRSQIKNYLNEAELASQEWREYERLKRRQEQRRRPSCLKL